nr:hypothetical protein [Tanacetum cinerariifolium]
MTISVINNSVFRGFFEKQKLTGPNFIYWYRKLRIVLSVKNKLNYLEHPIPAALVLAQVGQQVHPEAFAAHVAWVKGQKEIGGVENFVCPTSRARTSLNRKRVSRVQTGRRTVCVLICSKDEELYRQFGASRSSRVTNLAVSLILVSLRKEYDIFVQNYNMHNMGKTVNELHVMLKLHEKTLPKKDAHALHAIRAGKVRKKNNQNKKLQLAARGNNQGKGKSKLAYAPKPKIPPLPKKENSAKDSVTHGLKGSRKLKPGALSLYMGNGQRAAVEAIRSYDFCFPSGLVQKRIEKLQHDGLLNSTDIGSFEKRVSCMSEKMARKPYSHQVERAKDLLGLIHTDHKHEVNKTFKVFQKEVENQLGKTIKSRRSDHEGEYMSQEILDHLKEHEIIAHRTPYTRQHNGVFERINRTLLDMVCSMMSQTTLPKSF